MPLTKSKGSAKWSRLLNASQAGGQMLYSDRSSALENALGKIEDALPGLKLLLPSKEYAVPSALTWQTHKNDTTRTFCQGPSGPLKRAHKITSKTFKLLQVSLKHPLKSGWLFSRGELDLCRMDPGAASSNSFLAPKTLLKIPEGQLDPCWGCATPIYKGRHPVDGIWKESLASRESLMSRSGRGSSSQRVSPGHLA